MDKGAATEIIECLPKSRTLFHYFQDRYALELLKYHVGTGRSISEVKASPFARLLKKPIVKGLITELGNGVLTERALNSLWPKRYEAYVLTLGLWGGGRERWRGYYQSSRRGTNVVLQLNFSTKHDEPYTELVNPTERHPFEYTGHPIHKSGRHTLAWARLDIELDAGEALIEEIQSDWIRLALSGRILVERIEEADGERERVVVRRALERAGICGNKRELTKYLEEVLAPHIRMWDEAMLSATVWFLRQELGVFRIFYHTFDTGNRLKGIPGGCHLPPRSLYTDLPKRFCFQETDRCPSFIERRKHKREGPPMRFFLLEV